MSKINVIPLGMVNTYLLQGEGSILVDTGTKAHVNKILDAIKALGVQPEDIKLIVLTHNHEDHIGSLEQLVEATGAQTLMHKQDYDQLRGLISADIKPYAKVAKLMFALSKSSVNNSVPKEIPIDIKMEDTFDLSSFGVDAQIIHTPGHSKGSIAVLMSDGKAIIGDSLMANLPWSKPSRPMLAYSLDKIKESIEKLITLGANEFYLSHGKSYDVKEIKSALNRF